MTAQERYEALHPSAGRMFNPTRARKDNEETIDVGTMVINNQTGEITIK